jgi:outer membrane protein OmpA-like peptidoglycan-associated protein
MKNEAPMTISKFARAAAPIVAVLLALVRPTVSLNAQTHVTALTTDQIPMVRGVTIVQAVSDAKVGDYETTLRLAPATDDGVRIDFRGKDDRGLDRWYSITRHVRREDLLSGRMQVLGFATRDAEVIAGATAIGPSREFMRQLARQGQAHHLFRNYAAEADIIGTLQRVSTVPFPVLVNGERVTVPAVLARGQMASGGHLRPTEWLFLDHPAHPLTLKIAYGARGAAAAAPADWSRQVIRIDFASSVGRQLTDDCRARVPGIYFEFNSDQLNPASTPALEAIAQVLQQNAQWTVEIEGHTDNVGGAAYNLDLSGRRATAVKRALVTVYSIAAARMSTRGFGLTRPIESNETVEGRAMNRRVELVRQCQ